MKKDNKTRRSSENGIALLIAIFVLLLISVVAIALLVSSGTETALGANYRMSSTVYYAAIAGLEEARGRSLPKNPNYFDTRPDIHSSPARSLPLGQTIYVINRAQGDNIVPWDSSNCYYDNEYQTEFGIRGVKCFLAICPFGLGQQCSRYTWADLQVGSYQCRDRAVSLLTSKR